MRATSTSGSRDASRRGFLRRVALGGAAAGAAVVGGTARDALVAQPALAADALAGDGRTDDAPALQAMFDRGTAPQFVSGRTYLLNSPIFLDRAADTAMTVVDLNGATLRLGPGLPSTDAFWRDQTTTWAIFPNTKRSALWGTKVEVSAATRASGTGTGALISLVIRNGTIDGAGENRGFAFANRTGIRFEGIVLTRGRALLSWFDYADANVFLQCHNRAGGPAGSVLVEQISSGDGLLMQSCKSDAEIGLARLKYCRGAEITGTVTGVIELDNCAAVTIRAGHQEAPLKNRTMIDIRSSDVVIDTTSLYLSRGRRGASLPPAVRIADTASPPSRVVLRDATEMRALDDADEVLGQLLTVQSATVGTRIEARGLSSVASVRGYGGTWLPTAGPGITGPGSFDQALAQNAEKIASGDFVIEHAGTSWDVTRTSVASAAASAAPRVTRLAAMEALDGSMGASARYRFQTVHAGRVGAASAPTAGILPSTGSVRIDLTLSPSAQRLRVWRYRAGSSSPDAYLELPVRGATVSLFDTGSALTGMPWLAPGGNPSP